MGAGSGCRKRDRKSKKAGGTAGLFVIRVAGFVLRVFYRKTGTRFCGIRA
jgi:hypothetical protein